MRSLESKEESADSDRSSCVLPSTAGTLALTGRHACLTTCVTHKRAKRRIKEPKRQQQVSDRERERETQCFERRFPFLYSNLPTASQTLTRTRPHTLSQGNGITHTHSRSPYRECITRSSSRSCSSKQRTPLLARESKTHAPR